MFTRQSGQKARYQESLQTFGFGLAQETPEGGAVSADQGGVSWTVRFTYKKYTLSFGLTEEMMEDSNSLDLLASHTRHLAFSMRETEEIVHADIFNRSQDSSYVGGDGATLLATDHPMAIGGTWSNRLTNPADLSEASLEALLIMLMTAKDDRGKQIKLRAGKIIIPPQRYFDAIRILRSTLQSGTANNDPNALRSTDSLPSTPTVLTRCTLPNSYFLQTTARNGLKHYSRYDMRKKMEGDFSTGNMRSKAATRYVAGWEDPRCLYGSHGV
jgi:hypothetical protein